MRVIKNILNLCIYGYLVAVLGVLAIIWFSGDRWWFGTILMYGPRWIYALPMIVLVPLALLWRRKWLWPLGLTSMLIVWPIMGLNIQLSSRPGGKPPALRVLTYNVARWNVSGEEFSALLDEIQPEECANPRYWKLPAHWYVKRAGASLVVSRYPIVRTELLHRGPDVNGIYCVITTPDGPVGFACVDLLTPRRALTKILDKNKLFNLEQIDYTQSMIAKRWQESEQLFTWIDNFPESEKIIAGDFNLIVDSSIYRNIWAKYNNAFSQAEFGYGHTKKTRINIFNYTSRIDHILSTSGFKPLRGWLGPDYGSDHLPLIAEFAR